MIPRYLISLLSIALFTFSAQASWSKHYEYEGVYFAIDSNKKVVLYEPTPQALKNFELNLAIIEHIYLKQERLAFDDKLKNYNAKRFLEKNPCLNQYSKKTEFLQFTKEIATEIFNAENIVRLAAIATGPNFNIEQLESIYRFISNPQMNETNTPLNKRKLIAEYLNVYMSHSDKKAPLRLNRVIAENLDFFTKLREPFVTQNFPNLEKVCPTID